LPARRSLPSLKAWTNEGWVEITHPDKLIYSEDHITKQEFVDYYVRIAQTMLPYLKNRPLSMKRYVDGVDGKGFFQKEAGTYFPDWIDRVTVKKEGGVVHHVVVNNSATLVYLANQLVVEFHIWLSKMKKLDYPDRLIFDLDPSSYENVSEDKTGKKFGQVRKAALTLKKLLEELDLTPFVMATGSRGLHVVCPLKQDASFDTVHEFAHDIAKIMVEYDPEHLTLEMRKDKREGKIFVDYLRNSITATSICPYSTRPLPGASVATPLEWSEVSKKTLKPNQFTIHNIFKRLAQKGDVWKDINKHAGSVAKARKRLETLKKELE